MKDPKQIVQEMKEEGLTFSGLTNALIQARTNMRNDLDALKRQFSILSDHPEMHQLEAAVKNYDDLIELYR